MIVEFLKTGRTRKELYEEYEISTETISNWKKRYGAFVSSSSTE